MKCYRANCKCDDIKKMYCIYKLTEKQHRFIARIKKYKYCEECGNTTIKARYMGKVINLCTECGVRGERYENKTNNSITFDISSHSA